jgi:hypothetical protein
MAKAGVCKTPISGSIPLAAFFHAGTLDIYHLVRLTIGFSRNKPAGGK